MNATGWSAKLTQSLQLPLVVGKYVLLSRSVSFLGENGAV